MPLFRQKISAFVNSICSIYSAELPVRELAESRVKQSEQTLHSSIPLPYLRGFIMTPFQEVTFTRLTTQVQMRDKYVIGRMIDNSFCAKS